MSRLIVLVLLIASLSGCTTMEMFMAQDGDAQAQAVCIKGGPPEAAIVGGSLGTIVFARSGKGFSGVITIKKECEISVVQQ